MNTSPLLSKWATEVIKHFHNDLDEFIAESAAERAAELIELAHPGSMMPEAQGD